MSEPTPPSKPAAVWPWVLLGVLLLVSVALFFVHTPRDGSVPGRPW